MKQVSTGEVGLDRPNRFFVTPSSSLAVADGNRKVGNWQSWIRIFSCIGCKDSYLPGKSATGLVLNSCGWSRQPDNCWTKTRTGLIIPGMHEYHLENLSQDPIHGYIAFTAGSGSEEVFEQTLIDHPWIQRLRGIHQLQTAWWVFPTAEHTRFQHVLGVMHLASQAVTALYESLQAVCPDVPSRGYVESLLRLAGLLHDVGHGPFGHFFDEYYLQEYGLTHELLGAAIIEGPLAPLLEGVRRNPNSCLLADEKIDPLQISWLIRRPTGDNDEDQPRWLWLLRTLLSGIYTIDNMDFVLRDSYMSGYSVRPYDLDRLLRYSFFTQSGLTIHDRGVNALMRFMAARMELFRSVYFHRTVRAIDLTLVDLFRASKSHFFPGNPLENLEEYLRFTETSLLVDVSRWSLSEDPELKQLGDQWQQLLSRKIRWKMVCQRNLVFNETDSESSSIFSDPQLVETKLRQHLGPQWSDVELRVDIARGGLSSPYARACCRTEFLV